MNDNCYLIKIYLTIIVILISAFTPNSFAAKAPKRISQNISIDGNIDESPWHSAPVYQDFMVVNPDTGNAPEHKTQTRILYNDDGLYIAIQSFQPKESQIERLSARDNLIDRDHIAVMLDPSGKGLYGYVFNVGLGGSLSDGTIFDEREFAYEWNAPWQAKTQRFDDRWDTEIFIPWQVLKLPAASDKRTIGIMVERHVAYLAEKWSSPPVGHNRPVFLSAFTPLEFEVVAEKNELTFVPYFSSSFDRLNRQASHNYGFDLYYQPTSDSQLSLTVSPDFGLVENDEIVVNFSAFETFVPEKREFFLAGQEIFKPKGAMMVNTRRIGAAPDTPELAPDVSVTTGVGFSDIIAAGKYTGQSGNIRYGVLSAIEDDTTFDLDNDSQSTVQGRKFVALRSVYEMATTQGSYAAFGYLGTLTDHYYGAAQTHLFDSEYRSSDDKWQFNSQLYMSNRSDEQGYGQFFETIYSPEPGLKHTLRLRHIDRNLNLNDLGYLPRNDENQLYYGLRMPDSNDSSQYKTRTDGLWFDLRANNDGQRTTTRLGKWYRFTFDDLSRYNITVHYSDRGWNDLNTRGNGAYRTNGYLTVWQRWQSDRSKPFSYGVAGYIQQAQQGGTNRNIRPFIKYLPADNIAIDADIGYRQRHNWQLWQEADRIDTFNAKQINMTVKSTWIIDDAQELRLAMQWVGLRAEGKKAHRIDTDGYLYATDELRADSFAQANLAFQLRYKYQFAPLSDLYLVYSRGGRAFDSSVHQPQGFDDLLSGSVHDATADQLTMKVRYRF